jgi:hypothetical protein
MLAALVSCACVVAVPANGQTPAPAADGDRARVQLGPLGLTPSVALTNFGIDTNVFNDFEDPKRDFTFTVSPQVDALVRAGRSRLHVMARSDLVYFQQYSGERSADSAIDSRLEFRGSRVTPWISAALTSGRQRFGYEIDLRTRRTITDTAAGIDARLAGRTRVVLSAQRTGYAYDATEVFLGASLREALNHRNDSVGLELRYDLTPLTTFVVSTQTSRARFDFSPSRDTNSLRVDSGFDLSPFALVSGRGRVGYRTFDGVGGGLPAYSGLVASVAAGTTVKGRTRVDVATARDVTYSWELAYPYYVQTGATLTVTPRLTQRWDVQGKIGTQRLAYRPARGVPDLLPHRVDSYNVRGAGVGFRMGREMRLGFNVDRERRTSPVRRRDYLGYRTGISVTYGR